MNDRDWLNKLLVAQRVYNSIAASDENHTYRACAEIDTFIRWVFKQYGMEYPNKLDDNQ